ncbi:WD40-repeat-containing domain protein [Suillus discolor]|uniref:WD40-repeat-containing domain protein n=1 Tax=Suillus discolor TaxID=1912936 RepID=A0A9P7F0D9_9AGAM|nr:WD40-repeat-containing domain protein [Suillus discolor]KAG2101366.1 WD40-repeat-containing domain protein [Suillus discolor]
MSCTAANVKKTLAVTPCKTMRGHTGTVRGVAHLPGGHHIITCSADGSLRLWDLKSGAQIGSEWRDDGDEVAIIEMSLSPTGKTIASGSSNGTVRLWDVETGKVVVKWKGHASFVGPVCWSPNGGRVVSGSNDGTARVWDVKSGKPVKGLNPIETGHLSVYAVRYSPKASMIATGGCDESGIQIWDAKTGELLSTIELDQSVWSLTWTSDEKKFIAGVEDSIKIFDTTTWQQIAVLEGHTNVVYSLTLFPNDRLLASTSWDKTARLWNLETNLQIGPSLQHKTDVTCAAFSADGKLLSTAGWQDKNAHTWDIQDILKTAGLEDLLSVPDVSPNLTPTRYLIPNGYQAQKSELKKKLSGANATRRPPIRPAPRQVPPGFFDNVQGSGPSSTTRRLHPDPSLHRGRSAFALSWGSRPRALLAGLSSPFHRSPPNTDVLDEPQQRPLGPGTSSRRSPSVDVPALDDKKALYVARRPERASDKAKRVDTSKWWARVVLFLCCASPSNDDGH